MVLGGCGFYPDLRGQPGRYQAGPGHLQALLGDDDHRHHRRRLRGPADPLGGRPVPAALGRDAPAVPREHPLEILYTAIPILIVAVLFFFTVLTENNVDATAAGQRQRHRHRHAGGATSGSPPSSGVGGSTTRQLNVGVAGETTNGPNNHGPQMVVPVGQTVQVTLVSNDVIHGFYVREFNFSRYALPGVTNFFDLDRAPRGHLQRPVHPDLRPLPLRDALQRAGGEPDGLPRLGQRRDRGQGTPCRRSARRPRTSRRSTPTSPRPTPVRRPPHPKGSA